MLLAYPLGLENLKSKMSVLPPRFALQIDAWVDEKRRPKTVEESLSILDHI